MKILHTADWHVGRSIRGRSRADEHRAVLAEIADVARREAVDLVLVAGDTFDVVAPSAESERIVYQALLDLSDVAPVVLIAGNHDHPRRWRAVAPLFEMGRVTVGATLQRPDEGGVVRILTDAGETARIALVPFVGKRGIVGADDLMALDPFEHGGKYAGRVEAILGRLTEGMTSDEVNLVVAHLMIAEGRLGGGERIAFTVEDYAIPATAFGGALSYVALGHLHRMQSVPAPSPVWYAGSPMQLDFGERDDEKGLLIVDAEPGLPATVRPVPVTAGRRLIQLAGTLAELGPARRRSPTRTSRSSCTKPHGPGSVTSSESCFPTPSTCCSPHRETSTRRIVTYASAARLASCSSSISNRSMLPMTTSSLSSTRCLETSMRPERLELIGFTAFREVTEIDFTGADLFALTGPTGSGKSSIIDAIVFALYGSVPRYGDRRTVEPVITLGKVEARIRFDFTIGEERYTAVRVVRRLKKGATTAEARLEHDGTVVASGADEVTDAVQRLLGLSYDHFVKSVVLPQGRFAAFLHDKPTDRQKLLRELLDLGVYERVRERARDRKIAARQKAAMLEAQIADLAGATEEAEAAAVARVRDLEALLKVVEEATGEIVTLQTEAGTWAQQAKEAQAELDLLEGLEVPGGLDQLASKTVAVKQERGRAEETLKTAEERRRRAEKHLETLPELADLEKLAEAHQAFARAEGRLTRLGARSAEVRAGVAEAATKLEAARTALNDAKVSAAALRQAHTAHELVTTLRAGEPCPVCNRTVEVVPDREAPADLEVALATLHDAEQAHLGAQRLHASLTATLEELTTQAVAAAREAEELRERIAGRPDERGIADIRGRVIAAQDEMRDARAAEQAAMKGLGALDEQIKRLDEVVYEARRRFDAVRDRVAPLGPPSPRRDDLLADWTELVTWARHATDLRSRTVKEAAEKVAAAEQALGERRRTLVATVEEAGLTVGSRPVRDVCVDAIATAKLGLDRLRADRVQAAKLAVEAKEQRRIATVAGALEQHLRSNRFEAWLLEEALADLTVGANRLLHELSSGAYSLEAEGRGFTVIDHRNADGRRSVKTLSGGETFLVSLALALSLSEQLAAMSLSGNARLESIFLDEGFGTLDQETLDVVAGVVHELGATGRTVGLISHVEDLAEQVPTRFLVTKDAGGAHVERIDT
ncbi:MAG: exonuclease subunit SbcD [Actinobacteria bacterium]|nr:exonuclease subunit SbcD [Actinomycetota bacterium]